MTHTEYQNGDDPLNVKPHVAWTIAIVGAIIVIWLIGKITGVI